MIIPPPHPADDLANREQVRLGRQVVELTRARDEAIATIAGERGRVESAMQQCEHLASEVWSWRRKHEAAALELGEISAKLAHANATIQNMERSWFWRARLHWVRVRNLFEGDRRQHEEK
jgi:hypothetical protein